MHRTVFPLILLALFASSLAFAGSSSFRCGGSIVSLNASKMEVLGKCGEPTSKEVLGEQAVGGFATTTRQRPGYFGPQLRTRGAYNQRSVTVESWTYNCGASAFSYMLTFQGAQLIEIENIGYGFGDQSDCIGRAERVWRDRQ